jgi:hypothetical protein
MPDAHPISTALWNKGYWLDKHDHLEQLVAIAREFDFNEEQLVLYWCTYFPPDGRTVAVKHGNPPVTVHRQPVSDKAHQFEDFRKFILHRIEWVPLIHGHIATEKLSHLVEHAEKAEAGRERLLQELRALRTDFGGVRPPVQRNDDVTLYTACLVEHAEEIKTSNCSLVGHAEELKTTNHSLVEHAEKADLDRERILEELRGLRIELGQLARPSHSNSDRTFYVACGCLGVLVLMLFFK